MKLTYIANARLPTEKAHGIQIMKMCEAFAENGATVTLVVPWRVQKKTFKGKDPFDYYRIKKNFTIKKLPSIDFGYIGRPILYLLQNWSFACSAITYSLFAKSDLIFTRNEWVASLLSLYKKVIYEAHVFPKKRHSWYKRWMPRLHRVITINNELKKRYQQLIPPERILVAHDGVDLTAFKKLPSTQACRKKLNLPLREKIAVYTGHLYDWKGTDTIVNAASNVNGQLYLVGGTPDDVDKYRRLVKEKKLINVTIVGYVHPEKIPTYLKAADVVLLTSSGKHRVSKYYTSPLKLFEYMASGTPILSSDVPSSKEILNKTNAVFFEADNPTDFAKQLNWMFKHAQETKKKGTNAARDVKKYTWKKRARIILNHIYSKS